jgi:hypothetical protein
MNVTLHLLMMMRGGDIDGESIAVPVYLQVSSCHPAASCKLPTRVMMMMMQHRPSSPAATPALRALLCEQ